MRNVSVFECGLGFSFEDHSLLVEYQGQFLRVPVDAAKKVFDLIPPMDGVLITRGVNTVGLPLGLTDLEVTRSNHVIYIRVFSQVFEVGPDEASQLERLIFGPYSYGHSYDISGESHE